METESASDHIEPSRQPLRGQLGDRGEGLGFERKVVRGVVDGREDVLGREGEGVDHVQAEIEPTTPAVPSRMARGSRRCG